VAGQQQHAVADLHVPDARGAVGGHGDDVHAAGRQQHLDDAGRVPAQRQPPQPARLRAARRRLGWARVMARLPNRAVLAHALVVLSPQTSLCSKRLTFNQPQLVLGGHVNLDGSKRTMAATTRRLGLPSHHTSKVE